MKSTNLFTFFAFLFIIACNNNNSDTTDNIVTDSVTVENSPILNTVVSPRKFSGKVLVKKDEVSTIEIYEEGQAAVFQTIDTKGMDLHVEMENDFFKEATFLDLNFDGQEDMLVAQSVGNANIYYAYWIFNPTTNLFEANKEMELCLPSVDVEKKQISSNERSSAAKHIRTFYEYHKHNKHFAKVRREEITYQDETTYRIVATELQADGKMKEVQNELLKEK